MGKPHVCKQCGKSFITFNVLTKHVLVHGPRAPTTCLQCNKSVLCLKDHIKTHTEEKKYDCEHCGKSFTKRNLQKHVKFHSDNRKRYQCEPCGQLVINLKVHMIQHSIIKPFSCTECDKHYNLEG